MIRAAIDAGAIVLAGGEPLDGPGHFYPPTVLLANSPGPEDALAGAFGPVVVVRGVSDPRGGRRRREPRALSRSPRASGAAIDGRPADWPRMLHAGMVTINDAVTPTAHASAPFGGSKSSGFGRTKGPIGLLEFAQPQVVFERSVGGFRPQLFPYSSSAPPRAVLQDLPSSFPPAIEPLMRFASAPIIDVSRNSLSKLEAGRKYRRVPLQSGKLVSESRSESFVLAPTGRSNHRVEPTGLSIRTKSWPA